MAFFDPKAGSVQAIKLLLHACQERVCPRRYVSAYESRQHALELQTHCRKLTEDSAGRRKRIHAVLL